MLSLCYLRSAVSLLFNESHFPGCCMHPCYGQRTSSKFVADEIFMFFCFCRLPPFTLIHGTKDTIVPVESTLQFSEALTAAAVKASLFLLPHVGHTELVTDLMGSNRRYYHTILGCIKQGINKVTAHG